MVLYGKVAQLGPDGAWAYQRKVLAWMTLGMAGVVPLAAAGSWAIPLVAGAAFKQTIPAFQWLLLALIGMTYSIVMASQWIGRGLFSQAAAMTLATGLLNVVVSLLLVPRFGLYGSVWGTVVTYLVFSVPINGGFALWCELRFRQSRRLLTQSGALAMVEGKKT